MWRRSRTRKARFWPAVKGSSSPSTQRKCSENSWRDSPREDALDDPRCVPQLTLSLPETEERQHMNHPDFRVAGKIFATLGYPDKTRGMVKLSPEDQHNFSKDYPEAFTPVKGTWGRRGATSVLLKVARKDALQKAIEAAWRFNAPKASPTRKRAIKIVSQSKDGKPTL
ncbi:MAG: MmcQ/YjbR family DNA-binding protein [Acidobacteriota bacterium]